MWAHCILVNLSGSLRQRKKQMRRNLLNLNLNQFVIFKPLSYYFEETIRFDVKASFTSRPVSPLISWYNNQMIQQKNFDKRLFSSSELFMDWKLQTEMLNIKNCLLKHLIHCYNNANFTMAFLSEDNFFQDVKFTLWGITTFNFNLSKIKCKRWSDHWTYPFPNT